MQQLAAQARDRARHRLAAAPALARAEDGRADLDGRRQRLPRRDRAANAFGRFFNGQITAAGKIPPARCSSPAPASPASRRSAPPPTSAPSCAPTTRGPRSPTRWSRSAASSSKVDYEEEGSGGGGYAKVMSEASRRRSARDVRRTGQGCRHHHHHRADPGKPAPKLITAEMVRSRPGSVIVDMAAEQGRQLRTDRARRGRRAPRRDDRRLHRPRQPPRRQSSTLYSNNLLRLTEELCKTKDGVVDVNMDDDAIRGLTVIKDGARHLPPPPIKLPAAPPAAKPPPPPRRQGPQPRRRRADVGEVAGAVFGVGAAAVPAGRPVRAGQLPRPLHGVRARLLHRLHGDLERHAVAAHAADERDQRDLVDHRDRRADPDRARRWTRPAPRTGPTR